MAAARERKEGRARVVGAASVVVLSKGTEQLRPSNQHKRLRGHGRYPTVQVKEGGGQTGLREGARAKVQMGQNCLQAR